MKHLEAKAYFYEELMESKTELKGAQGTRNLPEC